MTPERLEDTIDRVARAMLAAPEQPAFSGRLRSRLEPPQGTNSHWVLAGSAALVLFVIVVMGLGRQGDFMARNAGARVVQLPTTSFAPPPALLATRPPVTAVNEAHTRRVEPASVRTVAGSVLRTSVFLPTASPEVLPPLHVAELSLEPLTIEPAAIDSLHVAGLELPAVQVINDVKEPQ